MSKKARLITTAAGGLDLRVERDGGNEVQILTGNKKRSLIFWKDLYKLSEQAIEMLEDSHYGDYNKNNINH